MIVGSGESQIECVLWGRVPYEEAWARQKELLQKRIQGEVSDTLIFVEHEPVITLGRESQRGEEPFVDQSSGIPVVPIERGGQSTYHGPGQLVIYPIFQLGRKKESWARSGVVNLIRSLEDWVIDYLASLELKSQAICDKTGVWVTAPGPAGVNFPQERKIASIGIAVKRWVSYHGLALNIDTGQEPWKAINPCGFEAQVMTDINRELSSKRSIDTVQNDLLGRAERHFVGPRQGRLDCSS